MSDGSGKSFINNILEPGLSPGQNCRLMVHEQWRQKAKNAFHNFFHSRVRLNQPAKKAFECLASE
jgi:hypothetical protein